MVTTDGYTTTDWQILAPSTDEENAELVALFSELESIERPTTWLVSSLFMGWCQWWQEEKCTMYLVCSESWLFRSKLTISFGRLIPRSTSYTICNFIGYFMPWALWKQRKHDSYQTENFCQILMSNSIWSDFTTESKSELGPLKTTFFLESPPSSFHTNVEYYHDNVTGCSCSSDW